MTTFGPDRRLAATPAADVVGYSRLMQAAEERTLSALKRHRAEFFDPLASSHGGRIFKVMSDGVLVEFASVLNAARCALDIQRGMPERNEGLPQDRQIRFRIGINLGDLIVEGDDVCGDGVNIAARLEALAPPDGISCSTAERAQVGNRLDVAFLDQGEKSVRNIAQPVHVFFIDVADPAAARGAAARRPDKPSIAVLPVANMSNDPEQEFFSDGITEDIITDLSKVSGLFVISRNTVFALRGKALDLTRIARQLGAQALALLGEPDRARMWLARDMAIDPDDNLLRYNAACVYAQLSELDRSIDLLEVNLKLVSKEGQMWFLNDIVLDPIRGHPRYVDLLSPIQ